MLQISAIDREQAVKILKVAVYVSVSAFLSAIIAKLADNPELFGPLTPIINVVLVTIKQAFTEPSEG